MLFTPLLNDSLVNTRKKQKNRDTYRDRCQSKENLPVKTKIMKIQQNPENLTASKPNKKTNKNQILKSSIDKKKFSSLLVNKNSFCSRFKNKIMVTCIHKRSDSLQKNKLTSKEGISSKFDYFEYNDSENNKKILNPKYKTLLHSSKVRSKSLKNRHQKNHLSSEKKKCIKYDLDNKYYTISKNNRYYVNSNNDSFNEDNKYKKRKNFINKSNPKLNINKVFKKSKTKNNINTNYNSKQKNNVKKSSSLRKIMVNARRNFSNIITPPCEISRKLSKNQALYKNNNENNANNMDNMINVKKVKKIDKSLNINKPILNNIDNNNCNKENLQKNVKSNEKKSYTDIIDGKFIATSINSCKLYFEQQKINNLFTENIRYDTQNDNENENNNEKKIVVIDDIKSENSFTTNNNNNLENNINLITKKFDEESTNINNNNANIKVEKNPEINQKRKNSLKKQLTNYPKYFPYNLTEQPQKQNHLRRLRKNRHKTLSPSYKNPRYKNSKSKKTKTPEKPISNIFRSFQNSEELKNLIISNNKKSQNFYYYNILPGNNGKLVEKCIKTRNNWESSDNDSDFIFNLIWTPLSYQINFSQHSFNENIQFVNHFEYHNQLTNKANTFINLFRYCEFNKIDLFSFYPLTIVLSSNQEYLQYQIEGFKKCYNDIPNLINNNENNNLLDKKYINYFLVNFSRKIGTSQNMKIPQTHYIGKNLWILKRTNLNRGRQMKVLSDLNKIIKEINLMFSETKPNNLILQKYIEDPLLYQGRKFDIRIWVLFTYVAKDFKYEVYVFKEGHLKACSDIFNIESDNLFIHLTNYSVQKHNKNFSKTEIGNEISFELFQQELDKQNSNKNFKKDIFPEIIKIIGITAKAVKNKINAMGRKNCFEIFGYDFILDKNFQPFLLEINTNPGFEESSPLIKMLVPRMIDDALKLTIDRGLDYSGDVNKNKKSDFEVDGYSSEENMWLKIKSRI